MSPIPRPPSLTGAVLGAALLVAPLLAVTPALAAPAAGPLTVTAPAEAAVGETVTVAVELAGTVDVYAYALTVEVDPAVLAVVPESGSGPAGGFDHTATAEGEATLVHSRLGSSPALDGTLVTDLQLTVVGPGTASVDVDAELVGADGTTTSLPSAGTAQIVVADPDPTPTPGEPGPTPGEPGPTSPPDPPPAQEPAPTPTDDAAAPAVPPTGGGLAATGAAVRGLVLGGAAALALGTVLLALRARRHQAGAR